MVKNIYLDNSEVEQQCYHDDVLDKPERRKEEAKGHQVPLFRHNPLGAEKALVTEVDHFKVRAPLV